MRIFTDRQTDSRAIDVFKLICAILIVAIHKRPFESISGIVDFYFSDLFTRIAVPFFYAASGYFLFSKISFERDRLINNKENRIRIWNYIKRIVILYLLWSAIYLLWQIPYWNSIGWIGTAVLRDYIIALFIKGANYHFWYFVSLIYAVPILTMMFRTFNLRIVAVLCCLFYGFKCIIYSYAWIPIPHIELIQQVLEKISGIRDAVCIAIPYMMVGIIVARTSKKHNCRIGLIISVILLIVETSLLKFLTPNMNDFSYVIFSLPTCYYLFSCVLKANINKKWPFLAMRKISVILYCIHPLLLYLLNLIPGYTALNSLVGYCILLSVSLMLSTIIYRVSLKIKCLGALY